jgi:hypothetical protein
VNYRPEYGHQWSSKSYYRQLRIDPLPAESADDLLTSLLGTDVSLDSLKHTLIERTEGNPLFLEESVRTLAETKALIGERGAYRLAREAADDSGPAHGPGGPGRPHRPASSRGEAAAADRGRDREGCAAVPPPGGRRRTGRADRRGARPSAGGGVSLRAEPVPGGRVHVQPCTDGRGRLRQCADGPSPWSPRARGTGHAANPWRTARRAC